MSRQLTLLAVLTGASLLVAPLAAQPVTSPSQVERPAPSAVTTKSEKVASKAKSKKARASKSKKPSAKSKTSKKRAARAKAKTKAKRQAAARAARTAKPARVSATSQRSRPRADNMPRGFAWPPTAEMRAASRACERELDARGIAWSRAEGEGRIVAPITVPAMQIAGITYTSVYRKGPHKLDCQLARTLAVIGPELHDLGVREVRFGSIYRNTNVRAHGVTKNILSRHALGLAMDVVAFVDATGRVADVEKDYPAGDLLLRGIEDAINRSGRFRIVLTPKNDPISHADHFHIEVAVDYTAPSLSRR